ncbi:MAG: phytoene desaturase family protein [Acidocella sp.]|nr:phytoene desaturase family protein [Acidocella sp.]
MSKIAIIGAGIGGLVAALLLSSAGEEVHVFESAPSPGGKLREVAVGGTAVDAGPTVFTLRNVFESIFAQAGATLSDHITLLPLDRLAHHGWEDGSRLDLFADVSRNIDAISDFAGQAAGIGYKKFASRAKKIYEILDGHFMQVPQPGLSGLVRGAGPGLWGISPFAVLWNELGKYFKDERLRQLFARYATYCGSSPFLAPATLMLIAHAEQQGVWRIEGGMYRLATAIESLARTNGARFHYGARVAQVMVRGNRASGIQLADGQVHDADAVIANVELGALNGGLLGARARDAVAGMMARAQPSLSAQTWCATGTLTGAAAAHHNVFFAADYQAEFATLAAGKLPIDPTIYVCAPGGDRFFILVNAAPGSQPSPEEVQACLTVTLRKLRDCGMALMLDHVVPTGPQQFSQAFPGSNGALYGRSLVGWRDSFARPGSATRLPGLYLAGGSVHPGPGLPMAALSGRHAASLALTETSRRAVMPGGMSMQSAMTPATH